MAKISAHGTIIGTVEYTTTARRYMSDGTVLRNIGFGWKLHSKLKPGLSPRDAYETCQARLTEKLAANPAVAAYLHCLHSLTGLCKRWKLHAAVHMMPNDPDGVWSEACDGYGDNVSADLDEIVELCLSYRVAQRAAVPDAIAA